MTYWTSRFLGATALLSTLLAGAAHAEVAELRISQQFGIGYLPLQVARNKGLIEKHAKAAGIDGLKVSFVTLGGGSSTNDALLSDSIDIATGGVGPFVAAWAKTRGNFDVRGIAAVTALPIALVTTNPAVRTLRDFTAKDRIALPSAKVSIQAVTLQIAAEKEFGPGQHERLDPLTVSVKHPDALAALASGKSEITAHFGAPPFQQQELALPQARRITDSYEALGGPVTLNVAWAKASFRDKNPKVLAAFVDALREADAFINANPAETARIHLIEDQGSADEALVLSIIREPTAKFTVAPLNTIKYADFLFRTGQIKTKAESWKDLYFPDLHTEAGS
ncbi:nitrate ABC transporter substrate-binding protein [Paramagnetospirillum kuznetsovii]|uniref:Nitrate ABC transporter substrate-binding protein n=1 Tax=Paramagnetospirillum kuznetsovii TaxID=2053833 RepID=A0A364NU58_9PROT|nr:ABC transporter substrate-binding protein [Paramagnetospirillum kuznetsovii]RAU20540.1 nitrate ABC transporter substrate-binding protein [Paramagnetospirillum kuznetsovii]